MRRYLSLVVAIMSMVLLNGAELSNWLDTISPEEYLGVQEFDDGSFQVFWEGDPKDYPRAFILAREE